MAQHEIDTFEDLHDSDVRELSFDEGEVSISINTGYLSRKGIQFHASMYGSIQIYNAAHFVIRTVDWETGERHPYFARHRASELAARAIRYFELTQPVYGIEFSWVRESGHGGQPSDNYTTYIETRNRLQTSMPIEQARHEAALATWTMQKIALPNGFSKIGKLEEEIWQRDDPNWPTEVKGTIWRDIPNLDMSSGKLL